MRGSKWVHNHFAVYDSKEPAYHVCPISCTIVTTAGKASSFDSIYSFCLDSSTSQNALNVVKESSLPSTVD